MKFRIENYRGISGSVEFEAQPSKITAFFGPNGSGKSSIAGAVRALLLGDPVGVAGTTKKNAHILVHDGTPEANATVTTDDGGRAITWPECTSATEGAPPEGDEVAVGAVDPATMPQKERDKWLAQILRAEPSKADIVSAVGEEVADEVWDRIQRTGWDIAHRYYADRATEGKGAWRQVTGEQWGSKKGQSFRVDRWDRIGGKSESDLAAAVAAAEKVLREATAATAVSEAEAERFRDAAEKLETLRKQIAKKSDDEKSLRDKMSQIREALVVDPDDTSADVTLDNLRQKVSQYEEMEQKYQDFLAKFNAAEKKRSAIIEEIEMLKAPRAITECPECSTALIISGNRLYLSENEIPEESERIAELEKTLGKANKWIESRKRWLQEADIWMDEVFPLRGVDFDEQSRRLKEYRKTKCSLKRVVEAIEELRAQILDAEQAANRLKLLEISGGEKLSESEARQALEDARADIQAYRVQMQADEIHREIMRHLAIADALAPSGLRKKSMVSAIQYANGSIADVSPWPVTITEDLGIAYMGRPVHMCSESEQWRCTVSLQMWRAAETKSPLIIDRLDILDNRQKNVLFRALMKLPVPIIMMGKADNRDDVIDLSARDVGWSYWICGGQAERIS